MGLSLLLPGHIPPNERVPLPVEWGKVITDARLVAAIIDRLTFNAHIIETGSESYRIKSTQARRAKKS